MRDASAPTPAAPVVGVAAHAWHAAPLLLFRAVLAAGCLVVQGSELAAARVVEGEAPVMEVVDPAARMQGAVDFYVGLGFTRPALALQLELRAMGSIFSNYGIVEDNRFRVVLDTSETENPEFIICHEAFHYVQSTYIDFGKVDAELKSWLTEPTATAMAVACSGRQIPLPLSVCGDDIPSDDAQRAYFWRHLMQTDPTIVRDYFDFLAGTMPSQAEFTAWLEVRWERSFETLWEEFCAAILRREESPPFAQTTKEARDRRRRPRRGRRRGHRGRRPVPSAAAPRQPADSTDTFQYGG